LGAVTSIISEGNLNRTALTVVIKRRSEVEAPFNGNFNDTAVSGSRRRSSSRRWRHRRRCRGRDRRRSWFRDRRRCRFRNRWRSWFRDRWRSWFRDRWRSWFRDRWRSWFRDRRRSRLWDGWESLSCRVKFDFFLFLTWRSCLRVGHVDNSLGTVLIVSADINECFLDGIKAIFRG
jgi:hypothetical protein